ncbi:glycosyltransferase [Geomesophilobacter sediminis]|uniref:Glycosyltransferase n=1 Tax=Geomesophilobacter sediminis TaxID=2798584 RepID=A0A8J7IMZ0_9BACT|nr:glycosyltransferase [Geomesophilobacter sediminis]MBJ6723259.1 glycosyltransferase [Geomesophilobacter sediminis]
MGGANIDIVVPIWNKPNETRNCLVNLINFTPDARLVMMDNGSERETEKLLQELADGLDDRALLIRDDSNHGFVKAANRGIGRSEAPFIALLRSTTQVTSGWLQPILDFAASHPEAGILMPRLAAVEPPSTGPIEVASCSFTAMVMTRAAYDAVGPFDEELDGGTWCLKDFTRRACSEGFLTYLIPTSRVFHEDEVALGSERRREETLRRSLATFIERWGEERSFLIHLPKGLEVDTLRHKLDILQTGAQHGDSYTILLPAALYKEALRVHLAFRHEKVRLVPLPLLSTASAKRRIFEKAVAENPGSTLVAGVDGIPFPWSDQFITFSDLSGMVRHR